jgi:eukaryotic-like serine/threonine-protein kinase
MTFPIINDYRNALRNSSGRFATLKLDPIVDENDQAVFLAGNFAVVFKVRSGEEGEVFALKCFIRDLPDLELRHSVISQYISKADSRYLVELGFLPNELYTTSTIAGNRDYPVVVMPWVEGNSLGNVIKRLCDKGHTKGLTAMTRAWANLCLNMLSKGVAHGDLKHDNVLVTPEGQFRLIDYDSMYTPKMKGLDSILLGGASYQHPARSIHHFDASLDHFSMLVTVLSLRALSIDPGLYDHFNTGENIIFSAPDFVSGGQSTLFRHLQQSQDKFVRDWTGKLMKSCGSKSIAVGGIERIMKNAKSVKEPVEKTVSSFSISRPPQQAIA